VEPGSLSAAPAGRLRGKGRWILLALVLVGGGYYGLTKLRSDAPRFNDGSQVVERVVPDSVRIKVEVLNASGIRGLARRGTFHVRDLGFDVVASGNHSERLDSTVVIVRSGRMDWGELAAKALGGARIETRPDDSRYLDLTILLGTSWRPPAETFHP
jgi:hypothetical protein